MFILSTLKGLSSFLSSLVGKSGVKRTDTEVLAALPPISTIGKPRESTNCSSWSWKVSWHLRQLQHTIYPRQGHNFQFLMVVQPNISPQSAQLESLEKEPTAFLGPGLCHGKTHGKGGFLVILLWFNGSSVMSRRKLTFLAFPLARVEETMQKCTWVSLVEKAATGFFSHGESDCKPFGNFYGNC